MTVYLRPVHYNLQIAVLVVNYDISNTFVYHSLPQGQQNEVISEFFL